MSDFALAEDFVPVYDISDAVATVADADREAAWRALLDARCRRRSHPAA